MIRIYCIMLLVLLQFQVFGQGLTITGKVSDAGDKLGIPGVTVLEKGTSNGVTTDIDGNFKLKVSKVDAVLLFSFIGYETQFIPVKGQAEINVKLKSADQKLNEVVVLGYGSVKSREAVVGSVEQIKSDELLKHSNAQSVDQMLEGQVAGVVIESDSGDPTSPVKVRIRGNNSLPDMGSSGFTASSEPLYILDGVPLIDALNPNINTGAGQAAETVINPLALINPEDIASVSILKDASAAAIYGANAANGVVIITTKKGSKGKTRISVSHKMLMSNPINEVKYLNTDQYTELASEFYRNGGYAEEDIPGLVGPTNVYTNWRDLTLQNSVSQSTNFSISGGAEKTTYRFSFGYKDNETTTKGNDFNTLTSRVNLNTELYPGIKLSYNGGLSSFKKESYGAFATYAFLPNIPVYDENGDYTKFTGLANPLADLDQNRNELDKFYTNNSLNLNVKINKNLRSSTTVGLDYTNTKKFLFYSKENGKGANKGGYIKEKRSVNKNWIAFSQLEYNGKYKKHTFGAIAGVQLKRDNTESTTTTDKNLITEKIILPGASADEDQTVSGYDNTSAMRSYYSRANYDFDKKYFLSLNYRTDASSFFGGDQQVEKFMSTGASWIISKENFWIENDIINFVKLKASYGKVGNAKVGAYSANGVYSYSTSSSYNGKLIATPYSAPNVDLGWQSSYKFNTGLTIKFLKKFNLDLEYYNNKTKDGIMNMKVIPETGWNSIPVNAVDLTNYGFEATLKAVNINFGELRWTSNINIGFNKSRLDKLANNLNVVTSGLIVGESTSLIMGHKYAGVNTQTGNPQWRLKDGTITDNYKLVSGNLEERVIIGKGNPDFSGGFSNSINYKSFNLNWLLTFESGADMFIPYPARDMEKVKTMYIFNKSINLLDRWQQPGDVTDIPRLDQSVSFDDSSSRFLYDKSNIALKSISLKYSFPKHICNYVKLSNASLGINVSNVYTWYKEATPSGRNGLAEYRYPFPQSRIFAFELKLGL